MLFRCRLCEAEFEDPTEATRHVGREHERSNFGWYVERVPDATTTERVAAWLSNLPLRVRSRFVDESL